MKDATSIIHQAVKRGFTLIELLVVIAIISLLVSILLPSLSRAKELARNMACMSQERNICLAMQMYASDNNGNWLPFGTLAHPVYGQAGWETYVAELMSIGTSGKETNSSGVFTCPTAHTQTRSNYEGQARTYAMNSFFDYDYGNGNFVNKNEAKFNQPSALAAIGDGEYQPFPQNKKWWWLQIGVTASAFGYRPPDVIHNGNVNIGFADGHVSAIAEDEVLDWDVTNGSINTTVVNWDNK